MKTTKLIGAAVVLSFIAQAEASENKQLPKSFTQFKETTGGSNKPNQPKICNTLCEVCDVLENLEDKNEDKVK